MRPENPYESNWKDKTFVDSGLYRAFEDAIDASFDLLKKEGLAITGGDYAEVISNWSTDGKVRIPGARHEFLGPGWLVFIEE